jgi:hypothetical protein
MFVYTDMKVVGGGGMWNHYVYTLIHNSRIHAKFNTLMTMKFHAVDFRVMTPDGLLSAYQNFGGRY